MDLRRPGDQGQVGGEARDPPKIPNSSNDRCRLSGVAWFLDFFFLNCGAKGSFRRINQTLCPPPFSSFEDEEKESFEPFALQSRFDAAMIFIYLRSILLK